MTNERHQPPDLALAAAQARIVDLERELQGYKANANVGVCLWCSEKVARVAEAIRGHLMTCSAHPMRQLEREVERLRGLLGLAGGVAR